MHSHRRRTLRREQNTRSRQPAQSTRSKSSRRSTRSATQNTPKKRREKINTASNSTMKYLEPLADKIVIGPGIWYILHSRTYRVDKKYAMEDIRMMDMKSKRILIRKRKDIIDMIYEIAEDFPCEDCTMYFKKYLRDNPPSYQGGYMSLFYWTIQFHNFKNGFLEKDAVDPETVRRFFDNGAKCESVGCSVGGVSSTRDLERRRTNVVPKTF